MGGGEIIWVVVSGTAVVSERGPGRVFGDQKGGVGLLSSFFFVPDRHGVRGLPPGYERLGQSVLIYSIWAVGKDHHRSAAPRSCVQLSTLGGRRIGRLDWI